MKVLHCIPNMNELDAYLEFATRNHMAFEYNDFFLPALLDEKDALKERINRYLEQGRDRSKDTLHGVFFDITVHSADKRIQKVSDYRIHQSMEIAMELGVNAVIFHTNNIPQLRTASYEQGWLYHNESYWRSLLEEYKELNIYLENMFDDEPRLIKNLAERLISEKRFGLCFDVAHANISKTGLDTWMDALSPYIRHVHINDNDRMIDSHDAVGEGTIRWNNWNDRMKEIPLEPSALIEVNGIEKLKKSIAYMKEHKIYPFNERTE